MKSSLKEKLKKRRDKGKLDVKSTSSNNTKDQNTSIELFAKLLIEASVNNKNFPVTKFLLDTYSKKFCINDVCCAEVTNTTLGNLSVDLYLITKGVTGIHDLLNKHALSRLVESKHRKQSFRIQDLLLHACSHGAVSSVNLILDYSLKNGFLEQLLANKQECYDTLSIKIYPDADGCQSIYFAEKQIHDLLVQYSNALKLVKSASPKKSKSNQISISDNNIKQDLLDKQQNSINETKKEKDIMPGNDNENQKTDVKDVKNNDTKTSGIEIINESKKGSITVDENGTVNITGKHDTIFIGDNSVKSINNKPKNAENHKKRRRRHLNLSDNSNDKTDDKVNSKDTIKPEDDSNKMNWIVKDDMSVDDMLCMLANAISLNLERINEIKVNNNKLDTDVLQNSTEISEILDLVKKKTNSIKSESEFSKKSLSSFLLDEAISANSSRLVNELIQYAPNSGDKIYNLINVVHELKVKVLPQGAITSISGLYKKTISL